MPQIRPITDLRNTSEISDACHARREPVFITKNGYGDLVVMSIETYEEMLDCIATDKAIADNAGVDFVGVLSGETTPADLEKYTGTPPSIVVDTFNQIDRRYGPPSRPGNDL